MPYQPNPFQSTGVSNPAFGYPGQPQYPQYLFTPPVNTFQPVQQQQQAQQVQPVSVPGRIVRSIDDVTPQEVPMDGSTSVFPLQDGSAIYAKSWSQDGTIRTVKFVPEPLIQEPVEPSKTDQILDQLARLEQQVSQLSQSLN